MQTFGFIRMYIISKYQLVEEYKHYFTINIVMSWMCYGHDSNVFMYDHLL